MMNDILKILTPLLFLRIKGPGLKSIIWGWPLVISVALTIIFVAAPIEVNIFGNQGFIKSVNSLLAVLVGFFVASLAAIASFPDTPGGNLNKKIAGRTPTTLTVIRSGQKETETLSRRKFLCLLFGYDAFCTLFLYISGEFSYLFADNIRAATPENFQPYMIGVFLFLYLFMLCNLLTTLLLGLHHLAERMHRV